MPRTCITSFYSNGMQKANRKNEMLSVALERKLDLYNKSCKNYIRVTKREIEKETLDIDKIQYNSGQSSYGTPPDVVKVRAFTPFRRPTSALDEYSLGTSGNLVKPRGHSAPPRRGRPGSSYSDRPHTSTGAVGNNVIFEDFSDAEEIDDLPPSPRPFLQQTTKKPTEKLSNYISTPLPSAAGARRPQSGNKHIQFSGLSRDTIGISSAGADINDNDNTNRDTQVKKVSNPNKSTEVMAIRKERIVAQNCRKPREKYKRPTTTPTSIIPASVKLQNMQILELKRVVQQTFYLSLERRLHEFRKSYPIRRYVEKPKHSISI